MPMLGCKGPAVLISPIRPQLRKVRASEGHHAASSSDGGLTPPALGEKFVSVSSVLQQVARFSRLPPPPPPPPPRALRTSDPSS